MHLRDGLGPVVRALESSFGKPGKQSMGDLLDGLVLTILSQNTHDRNRDRAFRGLKQVFPTWGDVVQSDPTKLEDAIRIGGLGPTKARRIYGLLKDLERKEMNLTLDELREMSHAEVERFLLAIPGVGKKTARCVLLFELGYPAFPVDTHILRVTRRLGWIPTRASAERAHDILQDLVPPEDMYSLHLNLIQLGRTICLPRKPLCNTCPIRRQCRRGRGHSAAESFEARR